MIKSFYENAQLTSYFMVNDYQLKPEEDMKGIRMERTCRWHCCVYRKSRSAHTRSHQSTAIAKKGVRQSSRHKTSTQQSVCFCTRAVNSLKRKARNKPITSSIHRNTMCRNKRIPWRWKTCTLKTANVAESSRGDLTEGTGIPVRESEGDGAPQWLAGAMPSLSGPQQPFLAELEMPVLKFIWNFKELKQPTQSWRKTKLENAHFPKTWYKAPVIKTVDIFALDTVVTHCGTNGFLSRRCPPCAKEWSGMLTSLYLLQSTQNQLETKT